MYVSWINESKSKSIHNKIIMHIFPVFHIHLAQKNNSNKRTAVHTTLAAHEEEARKRWKKY